MKQVFNLNQVKNIVENVEKCRGAVASVAPWEPGEVLAFTNVPELEKHRESTVKVGDVFYLKTVRIGQIGHP